MLSTSIFLPSRENLIFLECSLNIKSFLIMKAYLENDLCIVPAGTGQVRNENRVFLSTARNRFVITVTRLKRPRIQIHL
jgi:hypothetical protein